VGCPPATPHPLPYTGAVPGARHGCVRQTSRLPPSTSGSMLRIDAGSVPGRTPAGISTLFENQKHSPRAQSAPACMFPPWRVLGGHVI